jgi:hypothetical protein
LFYSKSELTKNVRLGQNTKKISEKIWGVERRISDVAKQEMMQFSEHRILENFLNVLYELKDKNSCRIMEKKNILP